MALAIVAAIVVATVVATVAATVVETVVATVAAMVVATVAATVVATVVAMAAATVRVVLDKVWALLTSREFSQWLHHPPQHPAIYEIITKIYQQITISDHDRK